MITRRLRSVLVILSFSFVSHLSVTSVRAQESERVQVGDTCIYYAIVDNEEDVLKYRVYNECEAAVRVTIEVRPSSKDEDSEDCDATVVVDLGEDEDAYAQLPCPEGSGYVPNVFYEELE
jgi:hypothetical protein